MAKERWGVLAALVGVTIMTVSDAQETAPPRVIESRQGAVTRLETVGNLAPTHQLDCIAVEEIHNDDTPADLHTGVRRCFAAGRFEEAVRLTIVAGAYARFDAERVADVSARDAGQMLAHGSGQTLTPAQRSLFTAAAEPYRTDSTERRSLCAAVERLGPPNYVPDYMIRHGLQAMLQPASLAHPLVDGFDTAAAWNMVRSTYLHCA
jgi:hypothetical protein